MGCGCLLAPLKILGDFLRWCFTTGWKGLIILGICVILAVAGTCQVSKAVRGAITPTPKTTQVTEIPTPAKSAAPYIVRTPSRYYYALKAVQKKGITTMTDYWELTQNKWVLHKGTLIMGEEYGKVTVSRR